MMGAGIAMVCAAMSMVAAPKPAVILPEAPCAGWNAGPQRLVTPASIFEYMDGAGELYLAYGFRELYVREYRKRDQPSIVCEVYRMPSAADAYGLYSQDRTGTDMRIGQGAVYASGLLVAWQGSYFLRILAERETPAARQCVTDIARQTVKLCGPPGEPPAALKWLPKDGLDPRSVRFFHTHNCLNYFHFLATENLLGLSSRTNAVMGTYSGRKGRSLALAVGYPSESEARAAWAKLRRVYLAGLKPEGPYSLARLENGRWVGGAQVGSRLTIVLESPAREDCAGLVKRLISPERREKK